MEIFLQQIVNGVSLGSIYALIALGYTMVYGIIKLINFAHGEVYMIGAFVGYAVPMFLGNNFILSLVVSMVACALLGFTIEKIAYKPLRNSSRITLLITAIGVSLFLQYIMMFFVGAQARSYPKLLEKTIIDLQGVIVNSHQIYIVITTVILMFMLQFIVKNTKQGKAMRAVSLDRDAVVFALLILVLIIKPSGLLGKTVGEKV